MQGNQLNLAWSLGDRDLPRMTRVAEGVGRKVRVGGLDVVTLPQVGCDYFIHFLVFFSPGRRTRCSSSRAFRVGGNSKREGQLPNFRSSRNRRG